MTELIRSEVGDGIATITLDSPSNRNALSTALIEQLLAAFAAAVADPDVRVITLSHTGPVFSSGADLKETAAAASTGEMPVGRLGDVLAALWESPKPVLARVGGPARAGGLGVIAACDIAVCSVDATFAFSEVRVGVIPAIISASVLRRISPRAAVEMYLTGDVFNGVRAAEIGLVTTAVEAERVDGVVAAYAASLVRGGPNAITGTKDLLRRAPLAGFRDDVTALTEISVGYFGSAEGREGAAAFRDKRDPSWVPASPTDLE